MITPLNILVFILLYNIAASALIEPLTRTPVQPYSINKGYLTDYKFTVNIPSEIISNGNIEVEFPTAY